MSFVFSKQVSIILTLQAESSIMMKVGDDDGYLVMIIIQSSKFLGKKFV